MFTGIIEEVGQIVSVKRGQVSSRLKVKGSKIFEDIHLGDSIAVNGVCLTATTIDGDTFEADVMAETLRRTNLGTFRPGSRVNLERAMSADSFRPHRRDGHYIVDDPRGKRCLGEGHNRRQASKIYHREGFDNDRRHKSYGRRAGR